MEATEQKLIDRRLARIEGQIRGIRRMVSEEAYCCDVLNQIAAVNSAISQVAGLVASQHIKHCLIGHGTDEAHPATKCLSKEDVMDELDDILSRLVR